MGLVKTSPLRDNQLYGNTTGATVYLPPFTFSWSPAMRKKMLAAIAIGLVLGLILSRIWNLKSPQPQAEKHGQAGTMAKSPRRNKNYWEGDLPQISFRGKGDGQGLKIRCFRNEDAKCMDLSFQLEAGDRKIPFRGKVTGNKLEGPGFSLVFGYADNEEAYPLRAEGYFVIDGRKMEVRLAGIGSAGNEEHWREALKKAKLD